MEHSRNPQALRIESAALRSALGEAVDRPNAKRLSQAAGALQEAPERARLCGALIWSAFCAPSASQAVYDAVHAGLYGHPISDAPIDTDAAPLPEAFWDAFASVLTGPPEGYDAGSITAAVASLGGHVHQSFGKLAEDAATAHPGADNPAAKSLPGRLSLDVLAENPEASLAGTLHRMLVDNGFDPEVLDREAIGLAGLSPALRYLNTRILQMHDAWHLLAGYETTALHEIAISSFQLAQFGHNYSAMFLATITTRSHLTGGQGFDLLMKTICEAWAHGRETPPLMAIDIEHEWGDRIDTLRERHNIRPFEGSFPPDLLEQLSAMQGEAPA